MLKQRQILALTMFIFIFTAHSGLVLAAGKECTQLNDCSSGGEQCCCCFSDGTCDGAQHPGETPNKGRCFPTGVSCANVVCPFSAFTSVKGFIDSAVNYIFNISVILAPLMILIGAFLFLTSADNPTMTKLGREIIQWTAIGFAIVLFAKGVQAIIKMILTGG